MGKEAGLKSFEQVRRLCWRATNLPIMVSVMILCLNFLSFQVKDLHLHPEMFSIANGLLTPTLKSRRTDIRKAFQEQIASMYSKTAIWRTVIHTHTHPRVTGVQ